MVLGAVWLLCLAGTSSALSIANWGSENFLTLGYNVYKGFPEATGRDPGFTRPIFVLSLPSPSFFFTPDLGCVTSFTSSTVRSATELKEEMDKKASFETAGFGARFTANRNYIDAKQAMEEKNEVYIYSGADCSYFYAEVNSQELPELQEAIRVKLHSIVENPDMNEIKSLLANFGTHFVRSMRFGASFKYIYRMSSKAYESFEENYIDVNELASVIGLEKTAKAQFGSKYSSSVKNSFESEVSVQTVSIGATPPKDGDPRAWAASVKETPAPIMTTFSPIYNLVDHGNFTSHFSSLKRHAARTAMKQAFLDYCKVLRENEELESCTDVSAESVVTIADAYPVGVTACANKNVAACRVKHDMKLLGVIDVSNLDECNSRCGKEDGCLFTSFVKMTNQVNARCYLFQEGSKIMLRKISPSNQANVLGGRISIMSSKLTGNSGLEIIGLQVNRNTAALRKPQHSTHAACYNACKADRSCRVSMFCDSGCSDLLAQRRKKCYFYGKSLILNENFQLNSDSGYTVNIFKGI